MEVIEPHRPAQSPERDPSTLSNYWNFDVKKVDLTIDVLFDKKIIQGTIAYQLTTKGETSTIDLDTSYVDIKSATINGKETTTSLDERHPNLGSRLKVDLKESGDLELVIVFATTEKCTALQFLDKEATDGKVAPYLFCQCQPIHARSLFPCFDTPSVKTPYSFKTTSPYFTLMSGRPTKIEGNTYYFEQPIPIPSYLFSIASGDLAKAPIGPRSDVYTEPVNIKACQWEFEKDMENFIQIAEKLIFDYEWLRFDSLIMPASFPYGGMEIPNLCSLTPTLICKDRSEVSVMAHELAHSWSGNLVTNCSWEHFWLNEGWTVYIERRINEGIAIAEAREQGRSDAFEYGEAVRHFNAIIGWNDLQNSIESMGEAAATKSILVQNLKAGTDPDDVFSSVPYEKGFNLLYLIEQKVGGKRVFDKFIPYYFKKFRYISLDTYQFLDTLYGFFSDKHAELDSIDWNSWLYKPGMPPVDPKFDTTIADQCYDLAKKWLAKLTKGESLDSFSAEDIKYFNSNQSVVFLEALISYDKSGELKWRENKHALKFMDKIYSKYRTSSSPEILFKWYLLQVTGRQTEYYDVLGEWLGTVGRMKYTRPSYRLLNSVDHEKAVAYFNKFESMYHPICRSMVKKDLGLA